MPTIDGIVVDGQIIDTIVMPNGEEISVGGVTPTGNKNITSAGVTDVAQYATATVAEAELNTIFPVSADITWGFNALGSVTASYNDNESINFVGTPGFVDSNSTVTINAHTSRSYDLPVYSGTHTVVPSANDQTLPTQYRWMRNDIKVKGFSLQSKSKGYTPTGSQRTDTITADSGYDGLDKVSIIINAIPRGTAGTPTATKGTVSNHSVSVTPSVTNDSGYIDGHRITGTPVTVSASELVSGTLTLTDIGTADVTNYATVSVSITDGNNLEYGITDGTIPKAGIAKAGYAELGE